MTLPDNYTVERRNVKHTRLIITEYEKVLLYVPLSTDDKEIELILSKRKLWIERKLAFFHNRKKIQLARNEILLFGIPFAYVYDSKYKSRVKINYDSKVISSKKDLLEKSVQEKWYRSFAKEYITKRIQYLSKALNLPYNQLFIRTQKTKWGNCTIDKNISINWKLIKCPKYVIDYVCTHELCHTKIMNHGIQFQTLLKSLCPDEEKARKWLNDYGSSL